MSHLIKKIRGFGLIENLIALTVGLILLAGLIQLFIHAKMTYQLSEEMNQLQDNGRFISYYLPNLLRQAGYRTPPRSQLYSPFDAVFSEPFLTAQNDIGINGSDILTLRFQGHQDGKMRDCLQNPVPGNQVTTNILSINDAYQLECRTIHQNPALDQTGVLASGVENFQVLFGEDIDNDLSPDRYVPANYPGLDLNNIISIRISFLLQTQDNVSQVINNNQFNLLSVKYISPADKRVRKMFTTTIYLRNRASHSAT